MEWIGETVAVEEEMLLWEKVATSEWDPGPTVEWEISAEWKGAPETTGWEVETTGWEEETTGWEVETTEWEEEEDSALEAM